MAEFQRSFFRARAIDPQGLEGWNADGGFRVRTNPRAPLVPNSAVSPTSTNVIGVISPTNSSATEPLGGAPLKILPLPYPSARDPRLTGRVLFVLVLLSHHRRRIVLPTLKNRRNLNSSTATRRA